MSVYIPGMEMPTSCWECHFGHADTGVCVVDFKNHGDWNEPHGCPLIPVPEHGRLIDADELAQQYVIAQEQREKDKIDYCNAFMNNGEPCTEWWCVEDMLENAPTIIPAEEGE